MNQKPKKLLISCIDITKLEILDILCLKTKMTRDELVEEALSFLFEEYKEIIFDG